MVRPNVASDVKRVDGVYKTAATHALITGVSNHRLRILSLHIRSQSTTANNVYFKEEDGSATCFGTNSTDVEGLDLDGSRAELNFDHNPDGWFETGTAGKGFQMVLSAAQAVAVVLTYEELQD